MRTMGRHTCHEVDVFALNFLGSVLTYSMLRGIEMPVVSPPAIGVIPRDATGLQQRFELQENLVLAPPKHLRSDLPTAMINRVPQPARIRFARYKTPHCVAFRTPTETFITCVSPANRHFYLRRIEGSQHHGEENILGAYGARDRGPLHV